ncbi:MAG: N-acetylmuramoyl-L-alanine amidase [Desulfobacterales bacterium]
MPASDAAHAADLSSAFFEADGCARALRKDPAALKLRHNWERCIERFQAVYRRDERGPWAPASLFQAGVLYRDLAKFSRNPADEKKAVEFFDQIQKRFPDSAYRERAAAELNKMGAPAAKEEKPAKAPAPEKSAAAPPVAKPPAATKKSDAETKAAKQGYQSAEACFKQLRRGKPTEANRREWMLCIGRSRNVYLEDPAGEWVAASLYMEGMLYYDLHKGLRFNSDLKAAQENFEKIVKEHPDSSYAAKAAKELQGMPRPWAPATVARKPAPQAPLESGPPAAAPSKPARPGSKPAPDEEGLSVVQDMRHWSNPDYTRVVVYADRETDFTHRLLRADPSIDKPPRLYVDVANSTIGEGVQKSIPINDDLLSDARAARYTLDSVRVVLDIKSFETYKVFSLKDPFRIVIDVWGGNGASPSPAGPSGAAGEGLADKTRKMPRGALAKQLALGVRRVVIDAGHGGKDFGAPGFTPGVHEKDIVLQISKRLARKLREDVGIEVLMTRNDDRYLTLEERTAFANTHRADLFVSVHTNASRDPRAYGTETYFLNLATDDESIRVAAMENATSTKNISDLHSILNDLLKNAKINESSRLAAFVQSGMITHLAANGYPRIKDKGVKQAPFYVLLGARMPSILVETAFISNREECRLLTTAAFQEQVADSIVRGIRSYIQDISPTAWSAPPRGSSG